MDINNLRPWDILAGGVIAYVAYDIYKSYSNRIVRKQEAVTIPTSSGDTLPATTDKILIDKAALIERIQLYNDPAALKEYVDKYDADDVWATDE